jgi:hypothetical protein
VNCPYIWHAASYSCCFECTIGCNSNGEMCIDRFITLLGIKGTSATIAGI